MKDVEHEPPSPTISYVSTYIYSGVPLVASQPWRDPDPKVAEEHRCWNLCVWFSTLCSNVNRAAWHWGDILGLVSLLCYGSNAARGSGSWHRNSRLEGGTKEAQYARRLIIRGPARGANPSKGETYNGTLLGDETQKYCTPQWTGWTPLTVLSFKNVWWKWCEWIILTFRRP